MAHMHPTRRLTVTIALAVLAGTAAADTRRNFNNRGEPGANDFSYVRDHAKKVVTRSDTWVETVTNLPSGNWTNGFDIVMQQCHGGGFLNPSKELPKVTFASAAAHDESALNALNKVTGDVDNFTRAWVQSARYDTKANMYDNYNYATYGRKDWLGRLVVPKDPFAVAPAGLMHESPQYFGKGDNWWAGDGGRTLGGTDPNKRYAVLAAFSDNIEPRHEVNMMRIYRTLRDSYGVPAENIVVLHGAHTHGDRFGGWEKGKIGPLETQSIGSIFIDGPNTYEAFRKALNGELFTGAVPGADAELFLYTTGHGGHGRWKQKVEKDGSKVWTKFDLTGSFNSAKGIDWGNTMIDSVLDASDRGVQVQVSSVFDFRTMGENGGPVMFTVTNGARTMSFDAATALVLSDGAADVTSMLWDSSITPGTDIYNYIFRLMPCGDDDGFLQGDPSDIFELSIHNLSTSVLYSDHFKAHELLAAVMLTSGDQEYVHITPTPGVLTLLAGGALIAARRRRA
ncbi:MAG: hypothetical protein KF866_07830 [Phycisphaeraceae bacterium]|nr:hypothetical protein [Phycisphaeraceae bacterium]